MTHVSGAASRINDPPRGTGLLTAVQRERIEEDDEDAARAFTREQLDAVLGVVHRNHTTMFRVLAATGLRWSELAAIRWR